VRVLISGYIINSGKLGAAHQYLAKPFKAAEILPRIRCALEAQERIENSNLGRVVKELQSFPVMPTAVSDILRLLDDDEADMDGIADVLNKDGGILTKITHMANSPMFGGDTSTMDGKEALLRLGTPNIRSLLLSLHVFQSYSRLDFQLLPVSTIWSHCMKTASTGQRVARFSGMPIEAVNDTYFAGLVHELGRLLLIDYAPERYRRVCGSAQKRKSPLSVAEMDEFQASHMELAEFMLRLWGTPQNVVDPVRYQEAPWEGPPHDYMTSAAAIYIAHHISQLQSDPIPYVQPELDEDYLKSIQADKIIQELSLHQRRLHRAA
jgi:HD-like signal output (HDOD) protein